LVEINYIEGIGLLAAALTTYSFFAPSVQNLENQRRFSLFIDHFLLIFCRDYLLVNLWDIYAKPVNDSGQYHYLGFVLSNFGVYNQAQGF
jgi:hypothetical protein